MKGSFAAIGKFGIGEVERLHDLLQRVVERHSGHISLEQEDAFRLDHRTVYDTEAAEAYQRRIKEIVILYQLRLQTSYKVIRYYRIGFAFQPDVTGGAYDDVQTDDEVLYRPYVEGGAVGPRGDDACDGLTIAGAGCL